MFNYQFKKKFRLLHPKNFKYVFRKNCKKSFLGLMIIGRVNFLQYPRLGLSVPRRNVKYAHHRNLIKRLIRETFRLLQYKLKSMDFVVIAKRNIINLNNKKIMNALKLLWSHYYQ